MHTRRFKSFADSLGIDESLYDTKLTNSLINGTDPTKKFQESIIYILLAIGGSEGNVGR
jgi:hypothetical protein